jgi:DnaJ-class molecular chaperone
LWIQNYKLVSSIEGLQTFDPYQILELDINADEKAIRKQYRKMSLLKHPDKNRDNPLAVQEFIRLTKAYNVSTINHLNQSIDLN